MTPLTDWLQCPGGCGWVPPGHHCTLQAGRHGTIEAAASPTLILHPPEPPTREDQPIDWVCRMEVLGHDASQPDPSRAWHGQPPWCSVDTPCHGEICPRCDMLPRPPSSSDSSNPPKTELDLRGGDYVEGSLPPSNSLADAPNPPEGREWIICPEPFILNAEEMRLMPRQQIVQQVYHEDWVAIVVSCPDCSCAYKPQPYPTSPPAPDCPHGCGGRNRRVQGTQPAKAPLSTPEVR